jgi:hypothetical protein
MENIPIEKIKENVKKIDDPLEKKLTLEALDKFGISLIKSNNEFTNTKVRGFTLENKYHPVNYYIDILREVIHVVLLRHSKDIDKILAINGRKNKYFSKDMNDLRRPEKIRGTNIYFETNENAKTIVVRSEKILKLFGYDYLSFQIVVSSR